MRISSMDPGFQTGKLTAIAGYVPYRQTQRWHDDQSEEGRHMQALAALSPMAVILLLGALCIWAGAKTSKAALGVMVAVVATLGSLVGLICMIRALWILDVHSWNPPSKRLVCRACMRPTLRFARA